jgi:hypothetical protein
MADRVDAPDRAPPTPRSQLARVVVAAMLAAVLGGGPALAWDLSTQLPRPEPMSHWSKPSPWRDAGKSMKTAAGEIARLYLPRSRPAPTASEEPAAAPSPTAAVTATPSPSATFRPVPRVVHSRPPGMTY